jgi:hypothetical protein
VSGDNSPDEAAWRELVESYELSAGTEPGSAPWPDRENLGEPAAGSPGPPAQQQAAGTAATGENAEPPASAAGQGTAGQGTAGQGTAGQGTAGQGTAGPADGEAGPAESGPRPDPGSGERPAVDRARIVRHADPLPWRPATSPAADDDERYVPPPAPPLRLDPVAKGAWAALFGGPAYLLLATILDWQVTGWAALLAITAFVGGFAVVFLRMGDGPPRGDGPDNGAVV